MSIILILELVGTVAFAASGAIVGIKKKMDIFGVAILGLVAAVGGGILRDLILDVAPPAAFRSPLFAVTALFVSVIVFVKPALSPDEGKGGVYERLLLVMDAIGLGLFTVVGVQAARSASIDTNLFLETFVGVLTGVGGGLMRDVFAGYTPSIFVKDFYACASIIGAWACALLWPLLGENVAMFVGAVVIVALRLWAARHHWSLPRAK